MVFTTGATPPSLQALLPPKGTGLFELRPACCSLLTWPGMHTMQATGLQNQACSPAREVQCTPMSMQAGNRCSPGKGCTFSLFHDLALDTAALMQACLAITLLVLHGGGYLEAVAAVPAHRKKQQTAKMGTTSWAARGHK